VRTALGIGAFLVLLAGGRPDAGVPSGYTALDSGGWMVDCSKSRARCIVHVDGGPPFECPPGHICARFPGKTEH